MHGAHRRQQNTSAQRLFLYQHTSLFSIKLRGYSLGVIAGLEIHDRERALPAAWAVNRRRTAREGSKRHRGLELVATWGADGGLLERLLLVLRGVGLLRNLLLLLLLLLRLRVGVLFVAGGRGGRGLLRVRHVVWCKGDVEGLMFGLMDVERERGSWILYRACELRLRLWGAVEHAGGRGVLYKVWWRGG